ncbi:MAG TPA: L,D-transpeptidase family protein [Bacillales bacterium]|nr:L,D-transpeptidase family protein [Bacillales bacterium]
MKWIRLLAILTLLISISQPVHAAEKPNTKIYINLWKNQLYLIKNDDVAARYPIAPGSDQTPTPVGHFKVIRKSPDWGGGFGSRWLGLNVPWGKYGIHGTNKPHLVGRSVSSGCVRMKNKDVEELYPKVPVGTPVWIDGPIFGQGDYLYRNLAKGSKGTIVMLVQNRLRAAGLYDGEIDGIYGESTAAAVKKFQREHHLPVTGGIKKKMYRKLGLLE